VQSSGHVRHLPLRWISTLIGITGLGGLAGLTGGCAHSVVLPAGTQHPKAAYVVVPYPPPAALAETVPERPDRAGLVWLDGEWMYRGSTFVWRRGGWVVAPPAGRFATWQTRYTDDGRLLMASGSWYDERGRLDRTAASSNDSRQRNYARDCCGSVRAGSRCEATAATPIRIALRAGRKSRPRRRAWTCVNSAPKNRICAA
jgi:hypothetical protein